MMLNIQVLLPIHHVPVRHSRSLFLATVPHGRENNECRLAGGLEETKEGPNDNQAGKVGACGGAGKDGTPCNDAEAQILCDGNTSDDPVLWVFHDQDTNVDTSRQP